MRLHRSIWTLLSLVVLVGLWELCAALLQSRSLPPPTTVLDLAIAEARSGQLFYHLVITLARVTAAFLLAMLIGTAVGLALGLNRTANALFDPWLIFALNMPALVTIVLCYIWFGLNEAAA